MESTGTSSSDALGKTVANELTVQKFNSVSTNIAGTSINIHNSFKELETGGQPTCACEQTHARKLVHARINSLHASIACINSLHATQAIDWILLPACFHVLC